MGLFFRVFEVFFTEMMSMMGPEKDRLGCIGPKIEKLRIEAE